MEDQSVTILKPTQLLERLEFPKLLNHIAPHTQSARGRERIKNLTPSTNLPILQGVQYLIEELMLGLMGEDRFPVSQFMDITGLGTTISIENTHLELEDFVNIKLLCSVLFDIQTYFSKERIQKFPSLFAFWEMINYEDEPRKYLEQIIDEQGEVRDNASPELVRISKAIRKEEKSLDNQFNKLVTQYKKQGWLTENEESVRAGRRVLSLKSEHKRKISGIVHDESTTGKTTFVEPQEMVRLNNALFELWMERKKEIRRILIELSDRIRPFFDQIVHWQLKLEELDSLLARARFGVSIQGSLPKLTDQPLVELKEAYHPLLLLKNRTEGKYTQPMSIQMGKDHRMVLLSGPNAGGKSVSLKTVGLMVLMTQCGIPIPAQPESEVGLFRKIFVDIGDQQSIDDDLSTYSSRLTLMSSFIRSCDEETLILIDEFGSGTDPSIGGALAAEILMQFIQKQSRGFITTHYSDLKILADRQKGIVNAAMMFDKDTLKPSYQLRVGKPGSSYALEIAAQCGLPSKLIHRAKKRMGSGVYHVDRLLSNLEDEKKIIEKLVQDNEEKAKQLDRLMKSYQQMATDLEVKRKKMKLQKKQMDLQYQQKYERKLSESMKALKQVKSVEKMKALNKEAQHKKKKLKDELQSLNSEVYTVPPKDRKPLQVGDYVKHQKSQISGQLVRKEKQNGIVQVGVLTMTIPLVELLPSIEPLPYKPKSSIQTKLKKSSYDFKTQLDIRGLKAAEALQVVETFIDQALVANASQVKILHGKGNGVLKKMVWKKLGEYNHVQEIYHPDQEWGGDGITLVKLG